VVPVGESRHFEYSVGIRRSDYWNAGQLRADISGEVQRVAGTVEYWARGGKGYDALKPAPDPWVPESTARFRCRAEEIESHLSHRARRVGAAGLMRLNAVLIGAGRYARVKFRWAHSSTVRAADS
jgi:hypothetical protein